MTYTIPLERRQKLVELCVTHGMMPTDARIAVDMAQHAVDSAFTAAAAVISRIESPTTAAQAGLLMLQLLEEQCSASVRTIQAEVVSAGGELGRSGPC